VISLPWDYEFINYSAKIRIIAESVWLKSEIVGQMAEKRFSNLGSGENFGFTYLENLWGWSEKLGRIGLWQGCLYINKVYWSDF